MRSLLLVPILALSFTHSAFAQDESGRGFLNPSNVPSQAPPKLEYNLPADTDASVTHTTSDGTRQTVQSNTSSGGVDITSLRERSKDCRESRKTAGDACGNPLSTAGMSKSSAMTMGEKMMLLGQLGQMAASATGNSKICTIAAGLSSAAQVVSMIKGQACSGTQSSCEDECDEVYSLAGDFGTNPANSANEKTEAQKIRTEAAGFRRQCRGMAVQAGQAMLQAQMLASSLGQAAQCAKDTASNDPYGTPPPLSLGTGSTDCSNASFAATSLACICRSTPSDPMCGQLQGGAGSGGGAGGVAGGSMTTPGTSTDDATDGQVVDPAPKFEGKSGSNVAGSGGGGGGLGSGGGGGALGGGEGDGGGGSGLDKNVITGTSGGGGGVAGLSAGSSGGGGASRGGSAGAGAGGSGFDFKKYLPKSLFKNRGLAGMTVPSTDGITGPMGPSIWEKVSNRYQVKKSTLIQDK